MQRIHPLVLVSLSAVWLAACSNSAPTATPAAAPKVVSGAGDVTAVIEEYRALLGADNGGEPVSPGTGRREINWDGLPDDVAAPNPYASDLFNAAVAPRARGIVLNTEPGGVLVVSADGGYLCHL
jgi:hypothetical protein